MERVALLAEGDNVTASMLELQGAPETASVGQPAPIPAAASLEDAMRDHLLTALEQTRWNISRTAVLLDISRNTVRPGSTTWVAPVDGKQGKVRAYLPS